MNSGPEIVGGKRLFLEGFVYVRSKADGHRTYWDCNKVRNKECKARAITVFVGENVVVEKGPDVSQHAHPPNREEAEAEKIKLNLKRKATIDPEEPPAGMLRNQLTGVHARVICQLPERENWKKAIRRVRRQHLPPNPTSLLELGELPEEFKNTLTGDRFLIYDSHVVNEPNE